MESGEVFKLFYYQERGRFIISITIVVFSLFCFVFFSLVVSLGFSDWKMFCRNCLELRCI